MIRLLPPSILLLDPPSTPSPSLPPQEFTDGEFLNVPRNPDIYMWGKELCTERTDYKIRVRRIYGMHKSIFGCQ